MLHLWPWVRPLIYSHTRASVSQGTSCFCFLFLLLLSFNFNFNFNFIKKWEAENNKLPKNQRRPPPQKPMIFPSIDGNPNDIERMNQAAYESAQNQLIPCANCGRTFAPDRLAVHERTCRPKPGQQQQQQQQQSNGYGNGYGNVKTQLNQFM